MNKAIEIKFHVGDIIYRLDELASEVMPIKICRIEINPTTINYYGSDGVRYGGSDVDCYYDNAIDCMNKATEKMEQILESTIKGLKNNCKSEIEATKRNHLKQIKLLKRNVALLGDEKK